MVTAEKKYALIIANSVYEDALLRQLVAPSQDAGALAQVLADPSICGFEVRTLLDEPSYRVCEAIEDFLEERERDDLTLLYFSGHGITDDDGLLYYAARNTKRNRLRATSVAAPWVNEMISRCRSRRQILLLDCCHSGAFARTKSAATVNVGQQLAASAREEGRGRFVITASDAFQYSFEGDSVEGEGVYSVFTQALVLGLRSGEADLDSDGLITLDELYRFVHRRVREQTPQQSPRKWESDAEGTLVIGLNPRPAEAALPEDLLHAIDNLMPEARERAIPRLNTLLRGKHRGLALAAEKALMGLAEDDSRRVSSAAAKCLEDFGRGTGRLQAAPPSPPPASSLPPEAPPESPGPAIEFAVPVEIIKPAAKASTSPMVNVPADAAPPPSVPSTGFTIPLGEITGAGAKASTSPMVSVPAVALPPAETIGDGKGSIAAALPQAQKSDVELSPRGFRDRAVEKWQSLRQPVQILVCSAAVGVAWGAIYSFGSGMTSWLGAPKTFGFLTGTIMSVVLAFLLPLSVPHLTRNMRLRIVAVWILRTIAGIIVVLPPIASALFFSFFSSRRLFLICTLLFFDFVAGALTGMVVARATGKSWMRGAVVGGLFFLLARWLANTTPAYSSPWRDQGSYTDNALENAIYGFLRGGVGFLGILWFLRSRDVPAGPQA